MFSFFDGEIDLEEAAERINQNTRRFAKRQLTWTRRKVITTIKITNNQNIEQAHLKFLG
ncbi:MAG: hypothetical protein ISP68_04440 [Flavobacteriaceae bacterium]|nr:hypothetical protein [Flavobacteriaceae bacterium]